MRTPPPYGVEFDQTKIVVGRLRPLGAPVSITPSSAICSRTDKKGADRPKGDPPHTRGASLPGGELAWLHLGHGHGLGVLHARVRPILDDLLRVRVELLGHHT